MRNIWIAFLAVLSLSVFAQDFPERPNLSEGLVIDRVGILSASEIEALNQKLLSYEDTTSTQVLIYIAKPVNDDVNLYAAQLADAWGVGQKESNNGCIIFITMESLSSKENRHIAIQNGYGLEPYLTDATSKQIIDERIIPFFKQGYYHQGLEEGTNAIFQVLAGTFTGSGTTPPSSNFQFDFFFLFIVIILVVGRLNKNNGGGRGGMYGGGYWIGGMGGGHSGGGFSSGGSFGGFGGGGFGGGGASGSW